MSLSKVQDIVVRSAEKFSSFTHYQSVLPLLEKLEHSLSRQEVLASASSFFENDRRVNAKLVNEIIRAESRHRHARDMRQLNALSSVLALRFAPAYQFMRATNAFLTEC